MGQEAGRHTSQEQGRGRDAAPVPAAKPALTQARQAVRAINEDDDGYDPYSDYHDQPRREPLFEADPWR